MKLLTKALENSIPPLGSQDTKGKDAKIFVKFFTPDSNWTWYVTEGARQDNGDWEFFGLVDGHEKELGYFMLSDLQGIRGAIGLPIERDRYFAGTIGDVS